MMVHLTADETLVLRMTLGLSYWTRQTPTRNSSHGIYTDRYRTVMENLVKRGYMEETSTLGQGGREPYWKATPAGIEAVRDQPWK